MKTWKQFLIENQFLDSAIQKLNANPRMLPFGTIWTGSEALKKHFNLSDQEIQALKLSRYLVSVQGGFEIKSPYQMGHMPNDAVNKYDQLARRMQNGQPEEADFSDLETF